jgi:putative FmdB family regulatory protein
MYEYLCDDCGPFTVMRPMAECDLPHDCPRCTREAPRVILTAPHFSCLAPEARLAHATNERSRHAPQLLSASKQAHGPGCACCAPKSSRMVRRGRGGVKSFPASRPWMISH